MVRPRFRHCLLLLLGVWACQNSSADGVGVANTTDDGVTSDDDANGVNDDGVGNDDDVADDDNDADDRDGDADDNDNGGGDDGTTATDDVAADGAELETIRAEATPNEGTASCQYAMNDALPSGYRILDVGECDTSFAAPLPSGACDTELEKPCSAAHSRECGFDAGDTWQPQECGPCDEWLCDCLDDQWSCWIKAAGASACDEGSPGGANCGIPPLPTCDDVVADIADAIESGARCTDDEECFAAGDYNCDGEPDLIAASKRSAYDLAVLWLEPTKCFETIGCDVLPFSGEPAACVAGRCELVEPAPDSDGGASTTTNQCRAEGEVCLERQGPSSETTVIDVPCCEGFMCAGCVGGNNLERCTCMPEPVNPQPCGTETGSCDRSCAESCDIFEASGWCSVEMGFVDETQPVEWANCYASMPRQSLMDNCVNLPTGVERWCCPSDFNPVCDAP